MRERCTRRPITPLPPRGRRPMLKRGQLLDLGLCHHINLDAIATGTASPSILWDLVESVLTWWHVAKTLQAGVAEMDAQADLMTRMIARYSRSGRVLFDGPDLQMARDGVAVMDQLAALVSRADAIAATLWSEGEVARMQARLLGHRTREANRANA